MKKILIVLFASFLLVACADKPKADTLVVATSPDYAPYEFINPDKNGAIEGSDIVLAQYIADKLGKELVLEPADFASIPSGVSLDKYDIGISGFTFTEERAEIVDFSITYDTSESACQGILVKKDAVDQYKSFADFSGKKVAAQNASAQLMHAEKNLTGADIQLVAKTDDAILQLKNDKVDAIAISCAAGDIFMQNNDDLIMSDVQFEVDPDDGQMVIVSKENPELLKQINKIIEEINEQGLYTQWFLEAQEVATDLGLLD